MKESCLFVTEFVETLDVNNLGWPDGLAATFHVLIDFKTKKEIS